MPGLLRACLASLTLIIAIASPALAQSTFPARPIRFILPFPAGSGTDISARIIAQQISAQTGQSVVVDNRAGGNGLIAAQAAANAAPDGYTVFVTTMTTQVVNLFLYKKLPYDPAKDFAPVTLFSKSPMLLIVRAGPDTPKTVAELADRIRRNPGKVSFASGNTSSRVAAEMFGSIIGAPLIHVPYKGTPQAITDVISGQVDFMFPDLSPAVPLVKRGTEPTPLSPEQFGEFVRAEIEVWGRAVKAAGIQPE